MTVGCQGRRTIAVFESNKILQGDSAAEGQNFKGYGLAWVKLPCKVIASITRSITNGTLLMHIINLFPSDSLLGLVRFRRSNWVRNKFSMFVRVVGISIDWRGFGRLSAFASSISRSARGKFGGAVQHEAAKETCISARLRSQWVCDRKHSR